MPQCILCKVNSDFRFIARQLGYLDERNEDEHRIYAGAIETHEGATGDGHRTIHLENL